MRRTHHRRQRQWRRATLDRAAAGRTIHHRRIYQRLHTTQDRTRAQRLLAAISRHTEECRRRPHALCQAGSHSHQPQMLQRHQRLRIGHGQSAASVHHRRPNGRRQRSALLFGAAQRLGNPVLGLAYIQHTERTYRVRHRARYCRTTPQ